MTGPRVRPYRLGDERAINRAFNEVFGRQRPLAEWAWKFPLEPGGRAIELAERDGEVVAHFAGLPTRYRLDGRELEVANVVDVFARRGARRGVARRGDLFATAMSFFERLARERSQPFVFGFPSPRHRRLGRLQLGYIVLPPAPLEILARAPGGRPGGLHRIAYRAELARDWEPRLDRLWARARRDYPVGAVRDAAWAARRLAGHPSVAYHRFLVFPRLSSVPVAFVAFRLDGGLCRWIDLVWDHDHPGALELVARLSGRLAAAVGAGSELLWLGGDREGRALLERRGFEAGPEPQGLAMVVRLLDPSFDVGQLEGRAYVTMADADLV